LHKTGVAGVMDWLECRQRKQTMGMYDRGGAPPGTTIRDALGSDERPTMTLGSGERSTIAERTARAALVIIRSGKQVTGVRYLQKDGGWVVMAYANCR